MNSVPAEIYEILNKVVKDDLENFEVTIHDSNKKGEGYLGNMIFITLKNKISGEVFDFVVKQAFTEKNVRDMHPIRNVYLNEIYFYTQVWPKFNEFQERIPSKYQFQKLPKCYTTISEENCEKIVFENLKQQNFEMHNKKIPLNEEHYELIMKEYGKLHAICFAYKSFYSNEYSKLVEGLTDVFTEFGNKDYFQSGNVNAHETCLNSLKPGVDDAVIEKYKIYPEICRELYFDSIDCKTKYTVILHGDCWSNNMMFKYDENGKLTDVRFLDFQLSKVGSPCCDLSYSIYSGASKNVLDNLDYYLQVYHNSLSETLRQFGYDSENIYSFQALKADWKKYCKLGFIMGLMIWRVKMTYDNEIKDLEDITNESAEVIWAAAYDSEEYRRISRDLVLHMHENDFL